MHVVTNTIRRGERVYTAHLLRRSYREGGKVKKETLANLSHLPDEVIELIRGALGGRRYIDAESAFEIERSLTPRSSTRTAVRIAVVDDAGLLKAFRRMDGTPNGAIQWTIDKAVTAASTP